MTTTPVTEAAIDAATDAISGSWPAAWPQDALEHVGRKLARQALEAAAPHMAYRAGRAAGSAIAGLTRKAEAAYDEGGIGMLDSVIETFAEHPGKTFSTEQVIELLRAVRRDLCRPAATGSN